MINHENNHTLEYMTSVFQKKNILWLIFWQKDGINLEEPCGVGCTLVQWNEITHNCLYTAFKEEKDL